MVDIYEWVGMISFEKVSSATLVLFIRIIKYKEKVYFSSEREIVLNEIKHLS